MYKILDKEGPLTATQISKLISREKRTIQYHLSFLKKENRVIFTKLKRKFVDEYLWQVLR